MNDRTGSIGSTSARPVEAVTLQFHPDWPHWNGRVIDSMATDRQYSSQFVTGISNGSLTGVVGGARWRWESRLFAARYDDASASERPVYGAWNRKSDPLGGAPRFGSAYFRLRPDVVGRSTFFFPDSVLEPAEVGDEQLLPHLCRMADEATFDELDDYVEAHIHGQVSLATDVEALVLDPSFSGTEVERAAERLDCPIEFHQGFRASPDDFDPGYRGDRIVDLARSLGPELTPRIVGDAAREGVYPAQSIKQIWHYVARFGRQ